MDHERQLRIDELFRAVLARGREERAAFLNAACAGDDTLRRDVERLLALEHTSDTFSPAGAAAT